MSALDGSTGTLPDLGVSAPRARAPRGSGARILRRWSGWLFALPAAVMYAVFVLRPVASSIQYSFYDWNGISEATFVGVDNYVRVFTDPALLASITHALILIVFFTLVPVSLALVIAALIRELRVKWFGRLAQTLLFLPYIIPAAAAGVAWKWMYSSDGAVNQALRAVGLDSLTRAWLGDFTWALPAIGVIGPWINLGFCTLLLMAGIGKIDESLYEATRLDGATFLQSFRAVTLPGLRQEIGVCVTITIIAALASFDIVYMTTQGGPGYATTVPGVQIYQLGFTQSRVGLASALALVLSVMVLVIVLPLQRLFRER